MTLAQEAKKFIERQSVKVKLERWLKEDENREKFDALLSQVNETEEEHDRIRYMKP